MPSECRADIEYYKVLELPRTASDEEIRVSYRKLAIKWHPDAHRKKKDKVIAEAKFTEVSEAFEVLSDASKKKLYDKLGRKGLDDAAKRLAAHGNNTQLTRDEIYNSLMTGQPVFSQRAQHPPIEYTLWCTLLELYEGTTKRLPHKRITLNDSREPETIEEMLEVPVKKGCRDGTKIVFYLRGDETEERQAANISFAIKQRSHPVFRREKDDLVMTQDVDLRQALCGASFQVQTVDGRTLDVTVPDVISPDYVTVIKDEGMPLPKIPSLRGNLQIKYNIVFPTELSEKAKQKIGNLLP